MTAGEKRQAGRVIRNARPLERRLFDLISELQDAVNDTEPYDWESAKHHLHAIQDGLPPLFDLVRNIRREL